MKAFEKYITHKTGHKWERSLFLFTAVFIYIYINSIMYLFSIFLHENTPQLQDTVL